MLIMNITQCNQINCMIIIHYILLIFVNHAKLPLYKKTEVFLGGIIVHMNSEAAPRLFFLFSSFFLKKESSSYFFTYII